MMGVLHINHRENKISLDSHTEHRKIDLASGQYIYFYSPESGRWCFCHMENININGQEAMVKDFYDPEDPGSQKSEHR